MLILLDVLLIADLIIVEGLLKVLQVGSTVSVHAWVKIAGKLEIDRERLGGKQKGKDDRTSDEKNEVRIESEMTGKGQKGSASHRCSLW